MKTLSERIREFIKIKGLSNLGFEKACGLGNGWVSKNNNRVNPSTLEKIYKAYPELNSDWLEHGIGEMLLDGGGKNVVNVDSKTQQALPVPSLPSDVEGRVQAAVERMEEIGRRCDETLTKVNEMLVTCRIFSETASRNVSDTINLCQAAKQDRTDMKNLYDQMHQIQQEHIQKSREYIDNSILNIQNLRTSIQSMIDKQTKDTEEYTNKNFLLLSERCSTADVSDIRTGVMAMLSYFLTGKMPNVIDADILENP